MAAHHNREKEIFEQALDFEVREERSAFVRRACAEDLALYDRVRALLGAHETDPGFLPEDPESGDPIPRASERIGDWIGRYRLQEKIGEGGCGIVYVAEQQQPLHRRVALKVIKLGMDTREVVARFEAERQALAMMDHPNIARVFDGGATDTGRPYFVLELVRGVRITDFCDQHQLPTVERLKLLVQVCHAIQHAHQKGIIHRDIKPSNILVSLHDDVAVPKVIDFGIAKAVGERLTDKTLYTRLEQFLGTPAYMSPEQAGQSDLDIDTRSDIYALGVLLYELLTGRPPFDPKQLAEAGLDEMVRCIREQEPLRPSTRLSRLRGAELTTAAHRRGTEPPKLISLLRGDLDWIVMKCLEKNRTQRYEAANALARDIECYLSHEPIIARPPTTAYRVGKFVRRNKVMVASGTAVAAALVLGLVGSTWQAVRATKARSQARQAELAAERERDRAQAAQQATDLALRQLELRRAAESFRHDRAAEGLAVLAAVLRREPTNQVVAEWMVNELTQRSYPLPVIEHIRLDDIGHAAHYSPDGTKLLSVSRNNVARLWEAATGRPLTPWLEHDRSVVRSDQYLEGLHPLHADFSPDGSLVATASADRTARLWDARTGRPVGDPFAHSEAVTWIRFSPDGRLVATASGDGVVRCWNASTGLPSSQMAGHAQQVDTVEFSPDGEYLVSASRDFTARIWRTGSGQPVGTPLRHRHWVKHACFSPDGTRVLTTSEDGTAQLWNAATTAPLGPPLTHQDRVGMGCFNRDGRLVATASFDKTARLWNAFTGEPVGEPLRHQAVVRWVEFSPDGQRLVTASEDGTARVWEVGTGAPFGEPMGHCGIVWSARFSPDGRHVVTASADHTVRVWDVRPGQALALRMPHRTMVKAAEWSPDGGLIGTVDSGVSGWSSDTGVDRFLGLNPRRETAKAPTVTLACFSPNGRLLATGSEDNQVDLWDLSRSPPEQLSPGFRHAAPIGRVAFSPDGRWLVSASADNTAQVWDVETRQAAGAPLRHEEVVFDAQFSPDSRWVMTASADKSARVWDRNSHLAVLPPLTHAGAVAMARFSPDGRWVATASADRTARVWDARTGQPKSGPLQHNGPVNSVHFNPDCLRLVTASKDRTARVWRVESGQPIGDPLTHDDEVVTAEFSPDGRRVLTASRDGTARVWAADSGQPLAEPLRHGKYLTAAHFSPDGEWVLTASLDRTARIWRMLTLPQQPPAWLANLAEAVAGQRLTATGSLEETPGSELFRIRSERLGSHDRDGYARWTAWFFADRATRPLAPDSAWTVAEFIQERVRSACHRFKEGPTFIAEALAFEPTNGLALARLAQIKTRLEPTNNPSILAELEWLTVQATRLAPEEPLAAWAMANLLARRGEVEKALQWMKRVDQKGFKETCFYIDLTDLLVRMQRLPEAHTAFMSALQWVPRNDTAFDGNLRESVRANWAKQLGTNQLPRALRVFQLPARDPLPRRPDTPPRLLDLAPVYPDTLGMLWVHSGAALDAIADFEEPVVTLAGVSFEVRGALRSGPAPPGKVALVRSFSVRRPCRRLHFLHTAIDTLPQATRLGYSYVPPGTRLGSYRVCFPAEGSVEIPVIFGQDLGPFVAQANNTNAAPVAAWQYQAADGKWLQLFKTTWINPHPYLSIDRIEFHSNGSDTEFVLLAITAEP